MRGHNMFSLRNKKKQLLQICKAHTALSDSVIRSAAVIKLVSVLFGKCTTLVAMKCLTNGNQTIMW